MLAVIFTSLVKAENRQAFLEAACRHAEISRTQDKGCIRFDVLAPTEEKDEIIFIEIWENQACLDAHAERSKGGQEAPVLNALRYGKSMDKHEIIG